MFCQLHKYGFQASLFPGESVNQHIAVNELLEQQGLVLGITCKPYADILLPQGYGLHAGMALKNGQRLVYVGEHRYNQRVGGIDPGQDIVYISLQHHPSLVYDSYIRTELGQLRQDMGTDYYGFTRLLELL